MTEPEHVGGSGTTPTSKMFEELNKGFLSSCVESFQSMGTDCCLAPLALDYLQECLTLLSKIEPPADGVPPSFFMDVGKRVRTLLDEFHSLHSELDLKRPARVPSPPRPLYAKVEEEKPMEIQGVERPDGRSTQKSAERFENPPTRFGEAPEKKISNFLSGESKVTDSKSNFKFPFSTDASKQKSEEPPNISLLKTKLIKDHGIVATPVTSNGFVLGIPTTTSSSPTFLPPPPVFNGFGSGIEATASASTTQPPSTEDDEDEKSEREAQAHEFVPVTEADSLYSTKCKIFQKPAMSDKYEPRGLGMLYIQKTENGLHRLLVRADNSLGNILLNMNVTPDIPITLNLERKQVLTIDPHVPCPITILVKSPEIAQSFYNTLEQCRGSSTLTKTQSVK